MARILIDKNEQVLIKTTVNAKYRQRAKISRRVVGETNWSHLDYIEGGENETFASFSVQTEYQVEGQYKLGDWHSSKEASPSVQGKITTIRYDDSGVEPGGSDNDYNDLIVTVERI